MTIAYVRRAVMVGLMLVLAAFPVTHRKRRGRSWVPSSIKPAVFFPE